MFTSRRLNYRVVKIQPKTDNCVYIFLDRYTDFAKPRHLIFDRCYNAIMSEFNVHNAFVRFFDFDNIAFLITGREHLISLYISYCIDLSLCSEILTIQEYEADIFVIR